jgi:hypothetical protein
MIRELEMQEAMAVLGGQQDGVEFGSGGWVVNCTPNGNSYNRVTSGTVISSSGVVQNGSVYPVSEGYYANQEYRAGERDLNYFPVSVTVGC